MAAFLLVAMLMQAVVPPPKPVRPVEARSVHLSAQYLDLAYPNCSRWKPSVADIEAVLKASRPIRGEQFHDLDQSPCKVEGEWTVGTAKPTHFRIDAWGVVMLWIDGQESDDGFRYCDKACKKYWLFVDSCG